VRCIIELILNLSPFVATTINQITSALCHPRYAQFACQQLLTNVYTMKLFLGQLLASLLASKATRHIIASKHGVHKVSMPIKSMSARADASNSLCF